MDNLTIREIKAADQDAIIRIDAVYSGTAKPEYWRERLKPFLSENEDARFSFGYIAEQKNQLTGYILGEARAWEFGSPLCGWIYAIGVDPQFSRKGVGHALCREMCLKFRSLDIKTVRTMVRKDDIDVMSFFRASGFVAGPFVEMELGF